MRGWIRYTMCIFLLLVCLLYYFLSVQPIHKTAGKPISREKTVIIDAGHGGADGGAVAPDGTAEQAINLEIARYLQQHLQAFGIQTVMTRTDDSDLSAPSAKTIREKKVSDIHARMEILEKTPDAMFVSIHQNKYSSAAEHGTQIFYAPNTATTSANLADCIQSSVVSLLQPENKREIKKCGSSVYLLYHSKKTAVLVECGFLSNPQECAALKQPQYQNQMAFAVALGILSYINT